MQPKIGIVGVPLEDVLVKYQPITVHTYIPHITDEARRRIIERITSAGFPPIDLGELCMGEDYSLPFSLDVSKELDPVKSHSLRHNNMAYIIAARSFLQNKLKELDLTVAIGPSHLGAITLYSNNDTVARFDYHSDFEELTKKDAMQPTYSNYLDWVRWNIRGFKLTNYSVRWPAKTQRKILGKEAKDIEDTSYLNANHFDTDVDCIDESFGVHTGLYEHKNGPTHLKPSDLVQLIKAAKQVRKLGFWEYRLEHDEYELGLDMIIASILAAARNLS